MSKRIVSGDFPGGPAVKNPCFHCSVLVGELGSHMLSGEGGKGWGGGREGGREDEGKKEERKEENSVERWKLCPGNQTYFGISPGSKSNFAPA